MTTSDSLSSSTKETLNNTFPYTRLSSIKEDNSTKGWKLNDHILQEDDPSSVTHEWNLPLQGSKRPARPRSYALSSPDADHVANAITISSGNDNRGFNVSLNLNHRRLSESRNRGLTRSLPDLANLKVVTPVDNPAPVTQNQQQKAQKGWKLFRKRRSLSYISNDDRYDWWQCAGCQQLTESDKMNCKGCGGYAGSKAVAASLCKGCKVKVYVPADYERLCSDSSCPKCEMPLGNIPLTSPSFEIKKN